MSNIEEDIKFIEEMIKEYKTFGDLHNPDYEDTDKIYEALENMLKRIKELEEQVKILDEAYTGVIKESKKWFDIAHSSIPKQKVKDKIEEINKEYEDSKDKNGNSEYYYPDYTIRKFKELLEEK